MKLPLKFHQNRVNSSWDIPNMDKCNQDKFCLELGQMPPEQMLPGQMFCKQLAIVKEELENLPLNFGSKSEKYFQCLIK